MKLRVACLVLPMAFAPFGCRASVNAKASASGEGSADTEGSISEGGEEETSDFDKPLEPGSPGTAAEDQAPASEAPIGARQDLMFKGPGTLSCSCMSIALGPATTPAFEWGGTPPRTNPSTQFVVGFSSTPCQGAPADARASYWGYEVSGSDVIVVVENSREGRPVTVGAVIPKPFGDGQVYVRPLDKTVPFARGEGGRCQLGNPGAKRAPSSSAPESGTRGTGIRIGGKPPEDTGSRFTPMD